MTDQTNIVREDFGYAVWLPETTPRGQMVSITVREPDGRHMLHAETPDLSELYFEVTAYPGPVDHNELVREQREFLRVNSPDGTQSEVRQKTLGHLNGTTFDFRGLLQGQWKERRFLFVDGPTRTYRIVHDPTSQLNVQSLNSLELLAD